MIYVEYSGWSRPPARGAGTSVGGGVGERRAGRPRAAGHQGRADREHGRPRANHGDGHEDEGGRPGGLARDRVGHGELAHGRAPDPTRGPAEGEPAPEDERPHGGVGDPRLHDEPAGAPVALDADEAGGEYAEGQAGRRAGKLKGQVAAHRRHPFKVDDGDGDDGNKGREEAPQADGAAAQLGRDDVEREAGEEDDLGGVHGPYPFVCAVVCLYPTRSSVGQVGRAGIGARVDLCGENFLHPGVDRGGR